MATDIKDYQSRGTAPLQIMASSSRTPTTGSKSRPRITLARCCWKTTWLARRFTASTTSAFLNASSMHVALVHSAPSRCTRAWRSTPAQRFSRIPPAVHRFFSAAQPFSVAVVARTLFAMFVDLPLSSTPKRVSKSQQESGCSLCMVRGPRIHYRLLPSACKGFQPYLTLLNTNSTLSATFQTNSMADLIAWQATEILLATTSPCFSIKRH